MGFFFISLKLNMFPARLVITSLLLVSFMLVPGAAWAQTVVGAQVSGQSTQLQLLTLIVQLLEQLKSLQAKLAVMQVPTPVPSPSQTTPPVLDPTPAPEPVPTPVPSPISTGTLKVTVLNGLARCFTFPCEIPLFSTEVRVVVTNNSGNQVANEVTTTGYVTLKLPAGSYTITASAAGFVSKTVPATVVANQASEVKLTLNNY